MSVLVAFHQTLPYRAATECACVRASNDDRQQENSAYHGMLIAYSTYVTMSTVALLNQIAMCLLLVLVYDDAVVNIHVTYTEEQRVRLFLSF